MIKYNDDYYIDADNNCYMIKQDTHKKDKEGNEIYKTLGYYGSLNGSLKALVRLLVRNNVKEKQYDNIESAVEMVQKCTMDVDRKIDICVGDYN